MIANLKRLFSSPAKDQENQFLLSFIVIAYDMAREIERTLLSLSSQYQLQGNTIPYEVIVVDNGSPTPLKHSAVEKFGPHFHLLSMDKASPSPAAAINRGVAEAKGSHVAIIIDGARLVTPGVLYWAKQAFRLSPCAVVSVLGFHLGPCHQRDASEHGYNQAMEDQLLDRIKWPDAPYKLFEIASLAGSSKFGWLAPLAESNCIVVPRTLFENLGGYEEKFDSPGGGLVNLDFYKRVCATEGIDLYYLAGEGCFHQIHGGVTTGGKNNVVSRFDNLQSEYESIRGKPFRVPQNKPILLGGAAPETALITGLAGTKLAENNNADEARNSHFEAVGLPSHLDS